MSQNRIPVSQSYIDKPLVVNGHNSVGAGRLNSTAEDQESSFHNNLMLLTNESESSNGGSESFYVNHHLNSTDDLFPDLPTQLTQFATGCCLLFILVGIPGNLLTIIALARCKKVSLKIFFSNFFDKWNAGSNRKCAVS